MAQTSFDLSSFLAQQRGEGRFDSAGSFTVAVQEASRKLARYSLPSESAWVTKLLQAAVGWRSAELSLTQTSYASRFALRPSRRYGVPRAEEILKAFLSGDLGGSDPLSRFCLALMSLGEQARWPFLLVLDQEKKPQVFDAHFLAGDGGKLQDRHRFPGGIALTVSHIHAGESRLRARFSPALMATRSTTMARELYDQGPFCPMKLVHDGRHINVWYPERRRKERNVRCRPLLATGLSVKTRKTRPWIRPLDLPEAIWPEDRSRKPVPLPNSAEECDVILRLWHEGAGRAAMSCLYWLMDGVVVGRVRFGQSDSVRLEILADASELTMDLTGLSLVDSPRSEAERMAVALAVSRELQALEPRLKLHWPGLSLAAVFEGLRALGR